MSTNKKNELYDSSWTQYCKEMSVYEIPTPEREKELGRMLKYGTPEEKMKAKEEITLCNWRISADVANKYRGCGMEVIDLAIEGFTGLMLAADKWNFERGVKFSGFAFNWVNAVIYRHLNQNNSLIRLPEGFSRDLTEYRKWEMEFLAENARRPEVEEIVEHFGCTDDRAKLYQEDRFVSTLDIKTENDRPLEDVIKGANSAEEDVLGDDDFSKEEMYKVLKKYIGGKHADAVLTYVFDGKDGKTATFKEIGKKLGCSSETARKMVRTSLAQIAENERILKALNLVA